MNRPDAMNALSAALRDELAATIEALELMLICGFFLTCRHARFYRRPDLKELGQSDGGAISQCARSGARLGEFFWPHHCCRQWRGNYWRI